VFQANPNWLLLLERLPAAGLLKDDRRMLRRVRKLLG